MKNQDLVRKGLKFFLIISGMTLVAAYCTLLHGKYLFINPAHGSDRAPQSPQQIVQVEAFKKAGRQGDVSQIPVMIQTLQQRPEPYVAQTAMHTLALLGAIEAVPVLDSYIEGKASDLYGRPDQFLIDTAKVSKARLLAENEAGAISQPADQASMKVTLFFKNLGLSPTEINQGVSAYFQHGPEEMNKPAPIELKAMRELADMAYQKSYRNFAQLALASQVNFQLDYISGLEVRLAPLTKAGRATILVEDLSHVSNFGNAEAAEIRLAEGEGAAVSDAAATKLQQVEAQKGSYSPKSLAALISVLGGPGALDQSALLKHFSQDANPIISEQAKVRLQELNQSKQ